jgi:hypothetical protein
MEDTKKRIVDCFNIDGETSTKIIKKVEKLMTEMTMLEMIEYFLGNKSYTERELQFIMLVIGYMGSRNITIKEIAETIGEDRFIYLMNEKNPTYYQ